VQRAGISTALGVHHRSLIYTAFTSKEKNNMALSYFTAATFNIRTNKTATLTAEIVAIGLSSDWVSVSGVGSSSVEAVRPTAEGH
jgi:hypothetical protein